MEILLHCDFLIEALSSEEKSVVLDFCKTEKCKGWVSSTTLPVLLRALKNADKVKVSDLLRILSVITPTAIELEEALQDENFEEKLALNLVHSCQLDAVVSTNPEKFLGNDGSVLTAKQLESKINEPPGPVKEVKLLDISASYHQILNDEY